MEQITASWVKDVTDRDFQSEVIEKSRTVPVVVQEGDVARARREYLEAVRIEPGNHVSHVKLANIYANEGNVQEAIKELEFVMRIFPDETVRKKLERLKGR